MKPEIKQAWVDALRSGKFRQGHGQLQDNNGGYCCLGVLEKLAADEGVVEFQGKRFYLSEGVVEWAGLVNDNVVNPNNPLIGTEGDRYEFCGSLNDSGASFSDIADRIEKNL